MHAFNRRMSSYVAGEILCNLYSSVTGKDKVDHVKIIIIII